MRSNLDRVSLHLAVLSCVFVKMHYIRICIILLAERAVNLKTYEYSKEAAHPIFFISICYRVHFTRRAFRALFCAYLKLQLFCVINAFSPLSLKTD